MMPGMSMPSALPAGPDSAKKAMAAILSAVSSSCDCEACKILREMAQSLKADLLK